MISEFIETAGELYKIIRVLKESNHPNTDVWKEHLRADKVFRKDGLFYFCQHVPDAEIIEETNSNNNTE